jgi:hypothetical protein
MQKKIISNLFKRCFVQKTPIKNNGFPYVLPLGSHPAYDEAVHYLEQERSQLTARLNELQKDLQGKSFFYTIFLVCKKRNIFLNAIYIIETKDKTIFEQKTRSVDQLKKELAISEPIKHYQFALNEQGIFLFLLFSFF